MSDIGPKKKLARKQHIVPRWYLESFCDADGLLHVYETDKDPRRGSPGGECNERDFNEFSWGDEKTNNEYENWFARIEGDAKPVFDALCSRRTLSSQESATWSVFVASLFVRTRKMRLQMTTRTLKRLHNPDEIDAFARETQLELAIEGRIYSLTDLRRRAEKIAAAVDQNLAYFHLRHLPQSVASIHKALTRAKFYVIDATEQLPFVTSDAPVATMELMPNNVQIDFGCGIAKERALVFLPLTPNQAFLAVQKGWAFDSPLSYPSPITCRVATIQFAHRNVYASFASDDLRRMVDTQVNRIVFGENALR